MVGADVVDVASFVEENASRVVGVDEYVLLHMDRLAGVYTVLSEEWL